MRLVAGELSPDAVLSKDVAVRDIAPPVRRGRCHRRRCWIGTASRCAACGWSIPPDNGFVQHSRHPEGRVYGAGVPRNTPTDWDDRGRVIPPASAQGPLRRSVTPGGASFRRQRLSHAAAPAAESYPAAAMSRRRVRRAPRIAVGPDNEYGVDGKSDGHAVLHRHRRSAPTRFYRSRAYAFAQGLGLETPGELADDGVPEPLGAAENELASVMYVPTGGFGWITSGRPTAAQLPPECLISLQVTPGGGGQHRGSRRGVPAAWWCQVPSKEVPGGYTATFTDPDGHLWEAIVTAI